jgi:uncharacterized protein (TIGR02302 family)
MIKRRESHSLSDNEKKQHPFRLKLMMGLARLSLFSEQLWPRLLPLLGLISLYLILSWFSIWPLLSNYVRFGLLALFAIGMGMSLWPLRHIRWPSRLDARKRVEQESPFRHRPVTAVEDRPALGSDAFAEKLWQTHQKRMTAYLVHVKAGVPEPSTNRIDKYALRAPLLIGLAIGLLIAGSGWLERLGDAFITPPSAEAVDIRVDAWVSPPPYTARPPIFLTREGSPALTDNESLALPQGSVLTIRTGSAEGISVTYNDQAIEPTQQTEGAGPTDFSLKLEQDGTLSVKSGFSEKLAFSFEILDDTPPGYKLCTRPGTGRRRVFKTKL